MIGDVSALASDAVPSAIPTKLGSQKFVVPPIPSRPKGPTTPPTLGGIRPKTPTGQNPIIEPNRPLGRPNSKATSLGIPVINRLPEIPGSGRIATPAAPPPAATPAAPPPAATPAAPPPAVPAPPMVATRTVVAEIEVSEPTEVSSTPVPTTPAAPEATSAATDQARAETDDEVARRAARESRRTSLGIAVVPSGVMVLPAAPALRTASEEESRDTSVMEALDKPDEVDEVDEVDALGATMPLQPIRASGISPAIEEPTPSGDWTMKIGADGGRTIEKRIPEVRAAEAAANAADARPAGQAMRQPTGNWLIALDPSKPDGWSEPSKVDALPIAEAPPGPPASTVASSKLLDSSPRAPSIDPGADEGPKVQIDPTLIEPLQPMPALEADEPPVIVVPVAAARPPLPGMPLPAASVARPIAPTASAPARSVPEAPRPVTDAGAGFFRDSGDVANLSGESTAIGARTHPRRRLVIVAASAIAVALGIILVITLGKKDELRQPTANAARLEDEGRPATAPGNAEDTAPAITPPPGGDPAVAPGAPDEIELPADDAADAMPPPIEPGDVGAATDCSVPVASRPSGAEIVLDKATVGTTPATLTLPCGVEARLVLRKSRYVSAHRTITPKAGGQRPVRVALARVTLQVKVSSTPPGATITLAGKTIGVTPTMVKLPAFEAASLKIAKVGFGPVLKKITPTQNSMAVHVTLTKGAKRR